VIRTGSLDGVLDVTERAAEVLRAADAAARRFNPEARVRLRRDGGAVASDLTDEPDPGEERTSIQGIEVVLGPGLDGTLDAGDHGAFVFAARDR
jgi:hypothetical protein